MFQLQFYSVSERTEILAFSIPLSLFASCTFPAGLDT